MSTKPKNLDTYFKILGSVQDQTRFADSKAAFVAALNALLFGFMSRNFGSLKAIYTACQAGQVTCWLLFIFAAYLVASLLSLGFVIWAVISRFGELAPRSKVFFGHIARDFGNDCEKYVRETNGMTDVDWARDLGSQIVEVSHIALAKHKRVRLAAIWVFIALILWFVSFAFLFIMTP
jgi:Pycsar effector protein